MKKRPRKPKIRKIPLQGYIPDKIEIDHFTLGALAGEVLQPDGQWDKELPILEIQRKNYMGFRLN